jgi:hypothetical protein
MSMWYRWVRYIQRPWGVHIDRGRSRIKRGAVRKLGCSTGDTAGPIGNTTSVTCETIPVCILVLTGIGYNCIHYRGVQTPW